MSTESAKVFLQVFRMIAVVVAVLFHSNFESWLYPLQRKINEIEAYNRAQSVWSVFDFNWHFFMVVSSLIWCDMIYASYTKWQRESKIICKQNRTVRARVNGSFVPTFGHCDEQLLFLFFGHCFFNGCFFLFHCHENWIMIPKERRRRRRKRQQFTEKKEMQTKTMKWAAKTV